MPCLFFPFWTLRFRVGYIYPQFKKALWFLIFIKPFLWALMLGSIKEEYDKLNNFELSRNIKTPVASWWLLKNFHFLLTLHSKCLADLTVTKEHSHHTLTSDSGFVIPSSIDMPYSGTSFCSFFLVSWPHSALNEDFYQFLVPGWHFDLVQFHSEKWK